MNLRYLFCFAMSFISSLSFAMETNNEIIFKNREKRIREVIQNLGPKSKITVETPFFSSKGIQQDLINASIGGAEVKVRIANKSKADIEKLEDTGVNVKVVKNLHAKRVLCFDEDAEPKKQKTTFIGSDNLTLFSTFHREDMIKSNDSDFFDSNLKLFEDTNYSPSSSPKKIVKVTPEKPVVYNSQKYDLIQSKAERFQKLFEKLNVANSNKREADVVSMTFDHEGIVARLEKEYQNCDKNNAPRIRCFFDASASKHVDLLRRLKRAGGDNIKIYIFNQDHSEKIFNKFPVLQHRKLMTRNDGNKKLTIISTGNLAHKSNEEINYDSYFHDASLYDDIQKENDELLKECREYHLSPKKNVDTNGNSI